jgi:hypothetical protein
MMNPPKYARFPATLQASPPIRPERDMSVSEQIRLAKEALARPAVRDQLLTSFQPVPVTGQYYDLIRATQQVRTSAPPALTNAFVRGINNKAGGVKSFAAAGYNYPSGQMVIGAALAGMHPTGSPSEDRKRQMERMLGLAGTVDGKADWRKDCVLEPGKSRDANTTYFRACTVPMVVEQKWDAYCDLVADAEERRKCKIIPSDLPAPPWSVKGRVQRGLKFDAEQIAREAEKLKAEVEKRLPAAVGDVAPAVDAERARIAEAVRRGLTTVTIPVREAGRRTVLDLSQPAKSNTGLIVGGLAAVAAAFFLLRRK